MNPKHPHYDCSRIPQEIFTHIFSFLPISDRRNVRRICLAWYDACNSLEILRTEKLYINGWRVTSYLSLVFDTLIASRLRCLNLEFEGIQFQKCSLLFWKDCGPRIVSLTFRECIFENGVIFHQILANCVNLQYLHIDSTQGRETDDADWCSSNEAICEGFRMCKSEKNKELGPLKLQKLITLNLRKCHFLNDLTYNDVVSCFPNVREIILENMHNLNCHNRIDRRYYSEKEQSYSSADIFSFSCVFNHLKSNASQIEKLSFHDIGIFGLTPYWSNEIGNIPNLRLKYLSLRGCREVTEKSLANLLSKQTDLIKISLHDCSYSIPFKTINRMIVNCPKLECVDILNDFFEDEQMFQSLLLSTKLKEIRLIGKSLTNLHQRLSVDNSKRCRNNHLRALCLGKTNLYLVPKDIIACRNLTSLSLYNVEKVYPGIKMRNLKWWLQISDTDLQIVFHYLINLKTFKVFVGNAVSDYGFTGIIDYENLNEAYDVNIGNRNWTSSIRNLKNLEVLDVTACSETRITCRSVNEFFVPRLETLNLDFIHHELTGDEFVENVYLNTPKLKHIILKCARISYSNLLSLLQLKHLATLEMGFITQNENLKIKDYMELFKSKSTTSTLRSFKMSWPSEKYVFYRSIFTTQVTCCQWSSI